MMKKGINEFAGIFMDINIPKQNPTIAPQII